MESEIITNQNGIETREEDDQLSTKQADQLILNDSKSEECVNGDCDIKMNPTAIEEEEDTTEQEKLKSEMTDEQNNRLQEGEDESKESEWLDVVGNKHLMKKIIQKGEGENTRPDRGYVVTVNYSLKLEDGTLVEEQNDFTFTVGDAEVVQGLDLCMSLMETKETAEIQVNARFGYGELGRLPEIPPNARLFYEITLLEVLPPLNHEDMTMADRLKIGGSKRSKGNWWYSRGDYSQAIQCYRRSLDFLDDGETTMKGTDSELQTALDERLKVFNNLAASQLKLEAYEAALVSVENVLNIQPHNVKALFRKGKILGYKRQTNEAIKCLKRALQLEPDSKVIHQELTQLLSKQKSEVQSERDLYKRMLGQDKVASPSKKQKMFTGWSYLLGSFAVAVLGIFAFKQYHAAAY